MNNENPVKNPNYILEVEVHETDEDGKPLKTFQYSKHSVFADVEIKHAFILQIVLEEEMKKLDKFIKDAVKKFKEVKK